MKAAPLSKVLQQAKETYEPIFAATKANKEFLKTTRTLAALLCAFIPLHCAGILCKQWTICVESSDDSGFPSDAALLEQNALDVIRSQTSVTGNQVV